jgi:hypothetical protein
MSPFSYKLPIFRKFLNTLVTANLISFFNAYISLLYFILNVNQCVYKQFVALCCLKHLLVLVCLYFVLSMIKFYFSFSIKQWGFLSLFPIICKIILFSYVTSTLLFFCYIFLYPLFFDVYPIYQDLISLATWKFYGGCSKYCTADTTCNKYFYTPSSQYSWKSSSYLQVGDYTIVNNTTNIINVNFKSLITLMGSSINFTPLYIIYLLKRKSK